MEALRNTLTLIGTAQMPRRNADTDTLVLGLDPGTNAGITFGFSTNAFAALSLNCAARKPTKTKAGEPDYYRIGKFFELLESVLDMATESGSLPVSMLLVMESMFGFSVSKSQTQIGNELRGAAKAFCYRYGIRLVEIQPIELKRFAIGKSNADKVEMIQAAHKHGYTGKDDNIADSIHCYQFGHANRANYVTP